MRHNNRYVSTEKWTLPETKHSIRSRLIYPKDFKQEKFSGAFEYPHFYTPQTIAQKAAADLQSSLKNELPDLTSAAKGRMFGVLVVEDPQGKLGYLSAYSGEFQEALENVPFVPSVYQLPKGEEFAEMAGINAISKEIKSLKKSAGYIALKEELEQTRRSTQEKILAAKAAAKKAKRERDELRKKAQELPEQQRQQLLEDLSLQSATTGMDLRRFTRAENLKLEKANKAFINFEEKINALRKERKEKSAALQEEIFRAFVFYNAKGEKKDVKKVFTDYGVEVPPAGAGECAAPKLFQYAFQQKLKPIALAEFWWGASPNLEVREHGKFYPACKRKCEPILSFMLQGISVKPNPLLENFGAGKELEVLYEDDYLVVVNKPAGLLSVPGKTIEDSVQTRIQKKYPNAKGPMIVHRLDQDTSGIMIVTLTKEVHKILQQQFADRSISKTYVAVLEKAIEEHKGVIDLPLILDINHRPMQKVDHEHGKHAVTHYEVLDKNEKRTFIQLKPITGRSHQLRVHCAHQLGLHAPMLGDNLYGSPADRLYLHAKKIAFSHPITQQEMVVESEVPFSL